MSKTPIIPKPSWLKVRAPSGDNYSRIKDMLGELKLATVCQEAKCPNIGECWSGGTATFMLMGEVCTRGCRFCHIKTGNPKGAIDEFEPEKVAYSISKMGLEYVVITSVNRDELSDGGAAIWAQTVRSIREASPQTSVEVLIPDFCGDWDALQLVLDERPEILNHNMETVSRLYSVVRPQAKYERSIELLARAKAQGLTVKTGIMVGIGERDDEVLALMDDVRRQNADILTIGQYLQPTRNHLPIDRWVTPAQFETFRHEGLSRGFAVVESGALVRSSYHADAQADQLTGAAKETAEGMKRLLGG